MRILVTGAAGQLGNELHNVLEQNKPGITLYTDIHDLDLTDAAAVRKYIVDNEISYIVNCAAFTAVDKAEQEPAICAKVNTDAVKNIAEVAADYGVKVIQISTDYVFDGTAHMPYRESDKVNPISTYGTTKRKGEMVLLSMSPDAVIIRTAWLYSPYGNNFVKTMLRLGTERSELGVVCDQIGTPTYARDLAEAIYAILTARQWVPGIYHFSDEGACSWYDFTKAIHRIAGITGCNVKPIMTDDYPTAAARPPYSVLDKTRIKKTYGITIPHWEESLQNCIKQIQNN